MLINMDTGVILELCKTSDHHTRALLDQLLNPLNVDSSTSSGYTCLHKAAEKGWYGAVAFFVSHKANLNSIALGHKVCMSTRGQVSECIVFFFNVFSSCLYQT